MYIKFYDERRKQDLLVNLDQAEALSYKDSVLSVNKGTPSKRYDDEKEGKDRFDDIVDALNSDKVVVYDLTKEVGYWKTKPGPNTCLLYTSPSPRD